MDAHEPLVDKRMLNMNADWMEFYGDVVEEGPRDARDAGEASAPIGLCWFRPRK